MVAGGTFLSQENSKHVCTHTHMYTMCSHMHATQHVCIHPPICMHTQQTYTHATHVHMHTHIYVYTHTTHIHMQTTTQCTHNTCIHTHFVCKQPGCGHRCDQSRADGRTPSEGLNGMWLTLVTFTQQRSAPRTPVYHLS